MNNEMQTRAFALMPQSYAEKDHTVEAVLVTENPVRVWDWERGAVINEVLLMSGLRGAEPGTEVPLLDSHNRKSSEDQIGSTKILRTEEGSLIGRRQFSQANPRAGIIEGMVREGHLKAGSIGYVVEKAEWVAKGKAQTVEGREYVGPVKVATEWWLLEDSTTPIGADVHAKVRNTTTQIIVEEDSMADEKRAEPVVPVAAVEPKVEPKPAPAPVDEAKVREEAVKAERSRVAAIMELGALAGMRDRADALVAEGKSVDEARSILYAEAAKAGKLGGAPTTPAKDEGKDVLSRISTDDFAKALCGLSPY